jgi:hypothetical protein
MKQFENKKIISKTSVAVTAFHPIPCSGNFQFRSVIPSHVATIPHFQAKGLITILRN